jgi:hypothetical protein
MIAKQSEIRMPPTKQDIYMQQLLAKVYTTLLDVDRNGPTMIALTSLTQWIGTMLSAPPEQLAQC